MPSPRGAGRSRRPRRSARAAPASAPGRSEPKGSAEVLGVELDHADRPLRSRPRIGAQIIVRMPETARLSIWPSFSSPGRSSQQSATAPSRTSSTTVRLIVYGVPVSASWRMRGDGVRVRPVGPSVVEVDEAAVGLGEDEEQGVEHLVEHLVELQRRPTARTTSRMPRSASAGPVRACGRSRRESTLDAGADRRGRRLLVLDPDPGPVEDEPEVADPERLAVVEPDRPLALDRPALEVGVVPALQVLDVASRRRPADDPGVPARDGRLVEHDVAVVGPADQERSRADLDDPLGVPFRWIRSEGVAT